MNMDMKEKIKQELMDMKPCEITELILDTAKSDEGVKVLTDEYEKLEYLSMNNCDISTLKGFPALPNLKRLELMDNKIVDGLGALSGCTRLTHLNLSGNKIETYTVFEDLKPLTNMKHLEMFNCPITSEEDFREKCFEILPQILFLDGYDKDGAEAVISDDDEDVDDDEDDEEEDDEVGLSYLTGEHVDDEDESVDFVPGEEEEDIEDEEDEEAEEGSPMKDAPVVNGTSEPSGDAKEDSKDDAECVVENGEARGTKRKLESGDDSADGETAAKNGDAGEAATAE